MNHASGPVAEVADVIQFTAFLARQTDLVVAMAKLMPSFIKETTVLSRSRNATYVTKFLEAGNDKVICVSEGLIAVPPTISLSICWLWTK